MLTEQAMQNLVHRGSAQGENGMLLINTLSWQRNQWMKTESGWTRVSVPPMGCTVIDPTKVESTFDRQAFKAEKYLLENDLVRVRLNNNGEVLSFYDKESDREIITQGRAANQLAVYHDNGDAWDFSSLYSRKPAGTFRLESAEAFCDGPCCMLRQVYQFGKSTITQEVSLQLGSKQLQFRTQIQWNESGKLLKALFPLDIHTSEAVCDIQFGSIRRPTHDNTSWDMAKYEICAHKWIDLSQPDYGVALLNDCKYGHSVNDGRVELNLLRSTNYPGVDADKGNHEIVYALYPHCGDHTAGQVNKAGYELNAPLRTMQIPSVACRENAAFQDRSFIAVNNGSIVTEAVKQAEDSDDLIVRLYESSGRNGRAEISFPYRIHTAELVDMMENHIEDIETKGDRIVLDFKPFEIHTVKLCLTSNKG
jgi:alpha-mannosidase